MNWLPLKGLVRKGIRGLEVDWLSRRDSRRSSIATGHQMLLVWNSWISTRAGFLGFGYCEVENEVILEASQVTSTQYLAGRAFTGILARLKKAIEGQVVGSLNDQAGIKPKWGMREDSRHVSEDGTSDGQAFGVGDGLLNVCLRCPGAKCQKLAEGIPSGAVGL